MRLLFPALATAILGLSACDKGAPEPASRPPNATTAATAATASAAPAAPPVTRIPAPARIVAIGDLHGDLAATRAALRLAGAIDDKDHWAGGDLMVVQTGDEIDRGDDDRKILDLFDRLAGEAKAAGGAVIALDGNHEVMNVQLDFRYVTDGGFKDFAGAGGALLADPRLARLPEAARARGAAFLPGAPYAKMLAKRSAVAVVGDTVFVHGGLTPKWVRVGIDRMNRDLSAWMDGSAADVPAFATAEDGPLWSRRYSAAPDALDCKVLEEALALIPAKRMIMGHTVQRGGISPACGEKAWRIDVGLSHYYGGKPEVLEIKGEAVRVVR
jgi:hypothetical protein